MFLSYLLVLIIVVVLIKYYSIQNISKCSCNEKPLFDVVHNNIPDLREHYWVGDLLITLLLLFSLYVFVVHGADLTNIAVMFLVLILLKAITSMVTILPDPSEMCAEKHGGRKSVKAVYGTCNDLMFSVHTGTAFLLLFLLYDYISPTAFGLLCLYVGMLCIVTIVTKNHYTIDVIMSFFVAYFVTHALKN